ncbi:MAG: TolC family protein, partial [Flavobacteriales bacterium]|nr:TolC family protein [Flavobacteriales bacterium]
MNNLQFKLVLVAWLILGLKAKTSAQSYLDEYIQIGLSSNQTISEEKMELDKAILSLREAKTVFLPNIDLMADYFLADGGRTVDFPAGDLLNPVYGTLNELTQSNAFPQLENERILLNPDNFYDVKFRTSMPL